MEQLSAYYIVGPIKVDWLKTAVKSDEKVVRKLLEGWGPGHYSNSTKTAANFLNLSSFRYFHNQESLEYIGLTTFLHRTTTSSLRNSRV
jgi:hypothetical protein